RGGRPLALVVGGQGDELRQADRPQRIHGVDREPILRRRRELRRLRRRGRRLQQRGHAAVEFVDAQGDVIVTRQRVIIHLRVTRGAVRLGVGYGRVAIGLGDGGAVERGAAGLGAGIPNRIGLTGGRARVRLMASEGAAGAAVLFLGQALHRRYAGRRRGQQHGGGIIEQNVKVDV